MTTQNAVPPVECPLDYSDCWEPKCHKVCTVPWFHERSDRATHVDGSGVGEQP